MLVCSGGVTGVLVRASASGGSQLLVTFLATDGATRNRWDPGECTVGTCGQLPGACQRCGVKLMHATQVVVFFHMHWIWEVCCSVHCMDLASLDVVQFTS